MTPDEITVDMLVAFTQGELSIAESKEVEAATLRDPLLAARLNRLQTVLQTLREDDTVEVPESVLARARSVFSLNVRPSESWWQRMASVIASLRFDSNAAPALAGVRGDQETRQLSFAWPNAMLDLEIEQQPNSQERLLIGQLDLESGTPDLQVALVPAGTNSAVADAAADAGGVFTLRAPEGVYDLLVLSGECVIKVPGVHIR